MMVILFLVGLKLLFGFKVYMGALGLSVFINMKHKGHMRNTMDHLD